MDKERLEAMGPEALAEDLSDWLDRTDEADFTLSEVDAYLDILARKDPVASVFDPALAEKAFREKHPELFPAGGFHVLEGGGKAPRAKARRLAGRIAAVAAVAVLSTALVAQGLGLGFFGAIARWSKEQFTFSTTGEETEGGYTPNIQEEGHYSHGQAALDAFEVEEKMMPTWNPPSEEGVMLHFDVSVAEEDGYTLFTESHRADDGYGYTFEVRARRNAAEAAGDLQGVDGADTEIYAFDGRTYYIAPLGEDGYTVTWTAGRYSGRIYGNMDLETARHFARSVTQRDKHPYEPPDGSEPPEYDSIQAAMAAVDIDEAYAPAWIPEGFAAVESFTRRSEVSRDTAHLFYTDVERERNMSIGIDWYHDPAMAGGTVYEKDDTPVIEYERGGITFYIMNNLSRKTVAWLDGNLSGSFSGELTVEECEQIIDSIPRYAKEA